MKQAPVPIDGSGGQRAATVVALWAIATAISWTPPLALAATLPPLVQPPVTEHHVGKMIFAELVTPDLATAKRF